MEGGWRGSTRAKRCFFVFRGETEAKTKAELARNYPTCRDGAQPRLDRDSSYYMRYEYSNVDSK